MLFVGKDLVGSGSESECPQATFSQSAGIGVLGNNVLIAPFNDQPQGFQQTSPAVPGSGGVLQNSATTFIVTEDYTECGPLGSLTAGGVTSNTGSVGYKISGQNPPTDDAGSGIYRGTTANYSYNFWQYKDATAAQTGFRYMVGVYAGDRSALSSDADDKYVVKSMSFKATIAGVSQLVLHCRKAAPTTGVTINASGYCKGIKLLKLNY